MRGVRERPDSRSKVSVGRRVLGVSRWLMVERGSESIGCDFPMFVVISGSFAYRRLKFH